jgi:hypothetical protein
VVEVNNAVDFDIADSLPGRSIYAHAADALALGLATRPTRSPVDLPEVITTSRRARSPSARPPSSGLISQASQCVNVPTGASGSSTISASEMASVSTARHSNAGERSSPAHEYRRGIGCPAADAHRD